MFGRTIEFVQPDAMPEVERFFQDARFAFRRLWPRGLHECSESGLLCAARVRSRVRGVLGCSQQNPLVYSVCASAFGSETDIEQHMPALLRRMVEETSSRGAELIMYVGTEDWLLPPLLSFGFVHEEDVITFMKSDQEQPRVEDVEAVAVRKAAEDDIDPLVCLDADAFPIEWHYGADVLREALVRADEFLVAEERHELIGYAYGDLQHGSAHITRLVVAPQEQRHGVGAKLLRDLLQAFHRRGVWWVTLNTQRKNVPSQRLYERFGFERIGRSVPVLLYRLQATEE